MSPRARWLLATLLVVLFALGTALAVWCLRGPTWTCVDVDPMSLSVPEGWPVAVDDGVVTAHDPAAVGPFTSTTLVVRPADPSRACPGPAPCIRGGDEGGSHGHVRWAEVQDDVWQVAVAEEVPADPFPRHRWSKRRVVRTAMKAHASIRHRAPGDPPGCTPTR